MKLDEIGEWSEIKLEIIKKYVSAFTEIMKNQSWCTGYIYIDAFAGAGVHLSKRTGDLVAGSPLNALLIEHPFTEYHFIDIDGAKIEALEKLAREKPNINIYPADCNEILCSKIFPSLQEDKFRRAVCFLDPYGLHLDWETIRHAGQLKTIEIFLNFPLMDMNRNVLHRELLTADPDQIDRMNRFCGTDGWQEILYKEDMQEKLFKAQNELDKIKTVNSNVKLCKWFKEERLMKDAGYKYVPEPILMRNSKGGPLFFLFFASYNKTGNKIVSDIFRKYREKM